MLLSMSAFALVTSLSPGPVNLVAMNSGARFGLRASLAHTLGAATGFTLLLIAIGAGLHELLARWPILLEGIRLAGVLYLLWLAALLAKDDGRIRDAEAGQPPTMLSGALMQWLNPKAWLASLAGMAAYAADGNATTIAVFGLVYFTVCFLSVGAWAWAGEYLRRYLHDPRRMRVFNRSLALLLVSSAGYLLLT
jgi:threonine/homoserine/homoserine lactone efflux protein